MNLFKEDTRHEEGKSVPIKNIEAVQELTNVIRTNLGPNGFLCFVWLLFSIYFIGLCKLVLTHLDKVIVTRRTETILYHLTVDHPVAKLVVLAAQNQAQEIGDGTTQIVAFIGELLQKIKSFILNGLSIKDIQEGLDTALSEALAEMDSLVVETVKDIAERKEVGKVLNSVIKAKMNGLVCLFAWD
jgi:chaperonin GroEL (HSP60 family)